MARRSGLDATAGLRSLLAILCVLHLATAFQFVPNSPCDSLCRDGSLSQDAVCLDNSYRDSENGTRIRDCVGCLLNSTAVDEVNNQTDVEWGLCRVIVPIRRPLLTMKHSCVTLHSLILHVRMAYRASLYIEPLPGDLPATERFGRPWHQ